MKETLLLTKHMRENPEDSHSLKSYEKNGGYESVKKVLKSGTPEEVLQEIKDSNIRGIFFPKYPFSYRSQMGLFS